MAAFVHEHRSRDRLLMLISSSGYSRRESSGIDIRSEGGSYLLMLRRLFHVLDSLLFLLLRKALVAWRLLHHSLACTWQRNRF